MVAYEGFPGRTLLEVPRYRAALMADYVQRARRTNPLLSEGDAETIAFQDMNGKINKGVLHAQYDEPAEVVKVVDHDHAV